MNIANEVTKLNCEDKNQKVVEGNKVLMDKSNNIKCLVGDFFYFGSYESIENVIKEIKNLPNPPSKLIFADRKMYGIWLTSEKCSIDDNSKEKLENQIKEFKLDTCDLECLDIGEFIDFLPIKIDMK